MSCQYQVLGVVGPIPVTDSPVATARSQSAIRLERHAGDHVAVTAQQPALSPVFSIPDAHGPIGARRGQPTSVWGKGDAGHVAVVPAQNVQDPTSKCVPDSRGTIGAAGGNLRSGWVK